MRHINIYLRKMDTRTIFVLMAHVLLTVLCDDILEQSRHQTGSKRDEADGILSKYQLFSTPDDKWTF